jgi:hypothetical protein
MRTHGQPAGGSIVPAVNLAVEVGGSYSKGHALQRNGSKVAFICESYHPYVMLVEPIGTLTEIPSEILNDSQIRLDCGFRKIATLEFFQHPSTQIGHVGLLGPTL